MARGDAVDVAMSNITHPIRTRCRAWVWTDEIAGEPVSPPPMPPIWQRHLDCYDFLGASLSPMRAI